MDCHHRRRKVMFLRLSVCSGGLADPGRRGQSGHGIRCGQLILRKKDSKIGATRCQILRLKCTKFDFRWGSAPNSAEGAYNAPPDP